MSLASKLTSIEYFRDMAQYSGVIIHDILGFVAAPNLHPEAPQP